MVRALESSTNTDFPKLGPAKSRIVDNSEVSSAFIIRESLCHRLRIFAFYLTPGHHLNLRLPLVQFDCASDADHVALERDGPAVARQFRACRDVARESLIRTISLRGTAGFCLGSALISHLPSRLTSFSVRSFVSIYSPRYTGVEAGLGEGVGDG